MNKGAFAEQSFSVTPVVRAGCVVLVLEGDLDLTGAPKLEAAFDACADGLPVVVDLSGLRFIDSAGLHALLEHGRPTALVREPESSVARVLDIVSADDALPLYDEVDAAVAGSARKRALGR